MPSRNLETLLEWQRYQSTGPDTNSSEFRDRLLQTFTPDIEMVEPPSVPFGGVYRGVDAYLTMRNRTAELWEQTLTDDHIWEVTDSDIIVKYSSMQFVARATNRVARFPSVQVIWFRDGRICRVEVFFQDSGVLLETLS
jgi:ketosteroid isomerase-like protein